MSVFFTGLVLGASLIIAIGAQNAFILRQGLLRQHVFVLCLICAVSDALLIIAGVAGFGAFVSAQPTLLMVVRVGGAAFLFAYAALALRRALNPEAMQAQGEGAKSLKAAVATCLAFTWLNPHVYLDTVVLVGGLSGQYQGDARLAFGAGAVAASFIWFFSLGYGAQMLIPLFQNPRAWQFLDGLIAIVMVSIGISLIVPFFT